MRHLPSQNFNKTYLQLLSKPANRQKVGWADGQKDKNNDKLCRLHNPLKQAGLQSETWTVNLPSCELSACRPRGRSACSPLCCRRLQPARCGHGSVDVLSLTMSATSRRCCTMTIIHACSTITADVIVVVTEVLLAAVATATSIL